MSEEAAAFARHNEPSDPFPIVPDEAFETAAAGIAGGDDGSMEDGSAPQGESLADGAGSRQTVEFNEADDAPADPIMAAVLAAGSHQFLRGLIGALARDAQSGAGDEASLGLVLAQLGQALGEGQELELAFQHLVDALDRRRLDAAALSAVSPIVAAFMARIAGGRKLQDDPAPVAAEARALVHAAEDVTGVARDSGGARAWRQLPEIAATIAHRAARRDLSLGALAEALPRLTARFGPGPRVVTDIDYSRGKLPRGGAAGEPRRMVISGPVEIVILDR